jgi:hypothetical protein
MLAQSLLVIGRQCHLVIMRPDQITFCQLAAVLATHLDFQFSHSYEAFTTLSTTKLRLVTLHRL